MVRKTTLADISGAEALAESLVGLFPGMDGPRDVEAFTETLKHFVERGEALTAELPGVPLAGLLLFSGAEREIAFLTVAETSRDQGIGSQLMARALEELGPGSISVVTFCEGHPKGAAARRLYLKFGFKDREILEIADCPVQRMTRE